MIKVVRISDGLGNQIFQYAFAKKICMATGDDVYLDVRFINNEDRKARGEKNCYLEENDHRVFGLEHFKISLPIANEQILSRWKYVDKRNIIEKGIFLLSKHKLWLSHYNEEKEAQKKVSIWNYMYPFPTYFQGYFFNLENFDDIKSILQKEFHLKTQMHLFGNLKRVLINEITVSIHVRRGDFIRLHCSICRERYYTRAIKELEKCISKPVYLVFSDDIEWVKENMKINGERMYISDKGYADYEEFTIMKNCKHNITANSTFSYWAAYLNPNPDKIVIYPKTWDKVEIIPDNWIGV